MHEHAFGNQHISFCAPQESTLPLHYRSSMFYVTYTDRGNYAHLLDLYLKVARLPLPIALNRRGHIELRTNAAYLAAALRSTRGRDDASTCSTLSAKLPFVKGHALDDGQALFLVMVSDHLWRAWRRSKTGVNVLSRLPTMRHDTARVHHPRTLQTSTPLRPSRRCLGYPALHCLQCTERQTTDAMATARNSHRLQMWRQSKCVIKTRTHGLSEVLPRRWLT